MRTHLPARPQRHAFTLVELLVVIGIIALLISILLPALNKARKQAMLVTERSNMRQVGLAILMYANDNKGHLPGGTGNGGCYPHTHDVVRQRLYGGSTHGGIAYLKPDPSLNGNRGVADNGPSSKVWGCPLTGDCSDDHRYARSWWWNAGCMNTCEESGRSITCLQNVAGNWWEFSDKADNYTLCITGRGYQDENRRQPNPENIVLITDAGGPVVVGWEMPGHLRQSPAGPCDVEGTNTLFLSGRVMWRTRDQLQQFWNGGLNCYR